MAVVKNLTPVRYPQFGKGDINTWSTLIRSLENRDEQVNNFLNNLTTTAAAVDYVPYLDDVDSDPLTALRILSSASGGFVFRGRPGYVYRVSGGGVSAGGSLIDVSNPSRVYIDFQNATLQLTDDCTNFIRINYPFGAISPVVSIGVGQTTYETGTTNVSTSRLEVSLGVDASVNDYFRLFSDDLIPGPEPADKERKAEVFTVASVETSGGSKFIYAWGDLKDTYTDNVRLAKYLCPYGNTVIKNLVFAATSAPTSTSWNPASLRLQHALGAKVENVFGSDLYNFMFLTRACAFTEVDNVGARNLRNNATAEQFGYVWVDSGGWSNKGKGLFGINTRHIYTTGAAIASTSTSDAGIYGGTWFFNISDSWGVDNHNSAFDTHPDARYGVFDNCDVVESRPGNDSGAYNFTARGRYVTFRNCNSYGRRGFWAFAEGTGVSGNSEGHSFINCTHTFGNATSPAWGFAFTGVSSASPAVGSRLINCEVRGGLRGATGLYVRNAIVEIENFKVQVTPETAFQGRVIETSSFFDINAKNITVDYRGAGSGLSLRAITLGGFSFGSIFIDGMDVKASGTGSFSSFIEAANMPDCFIEAINLNCDVTPSAVAGAINTTISSTYWVDYKVNNGRTSVRAFFPASFTTSTNTSINLGFRAAQTIYYEVSASAPVNIIGIAQGYSQGQQMYIYNDVASPFPVSIEATVGGLIAIGSNIVVSAGNTAVLVYDGARWL